MAILNYTTTIDAFKTVSEIEKILAKNGAKSILKEYDGEIISSMSFIINVDGNDIPVKLPVKIEECYKILCDEKKKGTKNIKATREQAEKVSWRILKDWVECQMALLDINMVKFEEIFLPYIIYENKKTVYEVFKEKKLFIDKAD